MAEYAWTVKSISTAELRGELYVPHTVLHDTTRLNNSIKYTDKKYFAMVIMPSSAGVCDTRERYYAQNLAAHGCICLIADAFARRGLTQCMTDQTLLDDRAMLEDAFAARNWLAGHENVGDIGILGVSKGGFAALDAAMSARQPSPAADMGGTREEASLPGKPFAVHVCLAPACAVQLRHPYTTGAPIFMLLGGKDDYTGTASALHYAERIEKTNGQPVETLIFPEACHAWESLGEPQYFPQAECYAGCLFYEEDDGSIINSTTGERLSAEAFRQQRRRFARYGAHAGGGTEQLRRATFDAILNFLEKNGFLSERG